MKIVDLKVKYPKSKDYIISGINTEFKSGEVVALLGRNGVGKTTFFKAISQRLDYSGEVICGGVTIKQNSNTRKLIDLYMEPVFIDYLNLEENIDYYLKLNKMQIKSQIIDEYLKDLGLINLKKYKPSKLSFGTKKRFQLLFVLLSEAKYILLDEPFVGLDIDGIEFIKKYVKLFKQQGNKTLIISSHQLNEFEEIFDRCLVLDNANIQYDGNDLNQAIKVLKGEKI